ncbi:MAG: Gfo/Idh/MocA family oxidoreductase [Candidatus Hinthialibacter antarcticus]|nr:Gfo/Idh/MocA family oxidoreductase [Candidatus Hinthialibacter antarcticus]
MKRRTVLQTGALSALAFQVPRAQSANDAIRIAVLGCGVRGMQHINEIHACQDLNAEVAAVCDVWAPALEAAAEKVHDNQDSRPKTFTNYREVLDDASIDAVVIATPDFGHAKILKEAAEAGKDAYCEKPMAVDFSEAIAAVDAVREQKRVVQVGTQWRSDGNFIACAQAAQSGELGKITRVSISQNFNQPRWRKPYGDVKQDDVHWDEFQMHRPKKPFDPKRFKRWYLYRDYTNGLPGLWMSHYYNFVAWAMQDPFPHTLCGSGDVYYWGDDGRETFDTIGIIAQYPSGFQLNFTMSLCNEADTHCIFYGTNGKLDAWKTTVSGDGGAGLDQIAAARTLEPVKTTSHHWDWIECIRSRKDPRTPIEMGLAHSVAGIMTAQSIRQGKVMKYDAERRKLGEA